ncbi:MAG TPA: 4Fe-4S binding protein [Polyangia bacterium]|jgi:NAD-dependent dihydropyrimidine dehydrogenase PreA subunit
MLYVITRLCRDCVDGACVEVCPVLDCIGEPQHTGGTFELPNQLFIDPRTCIGCGACEPVCPWEAIAEADDVPVPFAEDVALNARAAARPGGLVRPGVERRPQPGPAEVEANRRRWLDAPPAAAAGGVDVGEGRH